MHGTKILAGLCISCLNPCSDPDGAANGAMTKDEYREMKRLAAEAEEADPRMQSFKQFLESGSEAAEKYAAMFKRRAQTISTGVFIHITEH